MATSASSVPPINSALESTTTTNSKCLLTPRRRTKLVMLGETATGKTSLATRFAKKTFHEWQESTIGAAYLTGSITNGSCTFEIWDTAGQERYHSLAPMYYRGAKAAAVVYDITSRSSFERAKDWVAELRKDGPHLIVIALAGNKADLSSKREVPEEEAKAYADSLGIGFLETSAKSGFCVEQFFEMIAQQLPSAADSTTSFPAVDHSSRVTLSNIATAGGTPENAEPKSCC